MRWIHLNDLTQLDDMDLASQERPILLFKHSTRCNISRAALGRLESRWSVRDDAVHAAYHLDLLQHRALSNAVAERYGVEHASPQVLVIRNGRCIHTASHFGITHTDVMAALAI